MKVDIATGNDLDRGQESAVLINIAKQTGIVNVTEAAKSFLRGTFELVRVKILDMVGIVKTTTTTEKFFAKDKFRKDSKEVKFYGIWDNFQEWFLGEDGKVEEPIEEQELRYGNLIIGSVDGPIIEELGGEVKAETTLSELYELLKKQANGKEGDLLTNGYVNIFYIKDKCGDLRAVSAYCYDDGWDVYAYSVEDPHEWGAGNRVFSRNS